MSVDRTAGDSIPGSGVQTEALASFLKAAAESVQYDEARDAELTKVAEYLKGKIAEGKPIKMNFICTHNSRRSHMGAVMAAAAAVYHGVKNVQTYSGGTEGTALAPPAVGAMMRAGVSVTKMDSSSNPIYRLDVGQPLLMDCFSKRFDEAPNPTSDFAACMVCGSANEACPLVTGCDARFPLLYTDPKASDGGSATEQADAYTKALTQIGGELMVAFSRAVK
mmetsp:Transcript_52551/g.125518  ORF Transcript_52551/g.125518 Transcript_52551/m.125518 type:complete len:222 (+) Transcript_52551:102-767(+)|eukprot:CAMPEP_0178459208 /NCGR_PEP_ID=MMETSP0689_2-20121128/47992_1 /TAXON_ID=160604 /ORGANISM="Amphidinium massartii, Strain CS-259" /LENGTH=221 /DNA_ID=CAMNT_0020085639 /DNA_START=19 /DNA_END=684 /DNA_ORIENTATION=+